MFLPIFFSVLRLWENAFNNLGWKVLKINELELNPVLYAWRTLRNAIRLNGLMMRLNCILVRGFLHVKFHPGMKIVPKWNHPCLWWNVSYCLHVFAEMKFHPGMNSSRQKDRDEISSRDEKKKKGRVNISSRDEILKRAYFFKNFWGMYSNMLYVNVFEHNESMNILKHKASF